MATLPPDGSNFLSDEGGESGVLFSAAADQRGILMLPGQPREFFEHLDHQQYPLLHLLQARERLNRGSANVHRLHTGSGADDPRGVFRERQAASYGGSRGGLRSCRVENQT
jgi:hypothetical protein